MTEARPALSEGITSQELRRWYWLKSELAAFARTLGLSGTGSKQELAEKITARLDGARPPVIMQRPVPPPPLAEPLTTTTQIPPGQRCTQQLRHYFADTIGPAFRFDAAMRAFIAAGAGQTLAAAVDHWHNTRSKPRSEIGAQFELNRFVQRWHHDHPEGSRPAALEAWRVHRALPVDARSS